MKWALILSFMWITQTGEIHRVTHVKDLPPGTTKSACKAKIEPTLDDLEKSLGGSVYGVARATCVTDKPLTAA